MSIAPPTMEELAARMNDATIVDEEDVIAQMKRLAEGYEFEVDGRDGRGDASWWLYEHYSAKPDGTRLEEERFPGIEALPGVSRDFGKALLCCMMSRIPRSRGGLLETAPVARGLALKKAANSLVRFAASSRKS